MVLSRGRDESIIIGDDIRVMVIEIRGDKVRIGIEADKSITVHREEVFLAIQREKFLAENPEATNAKTPQAAKGDPA